MTRCAAMGPAASGGDDSRPVQGCRESGTSGPGGLALVACTGPLAGCSDGSGARCQCAAMSGDRSTRPAAAGPGALPPPQRGSRHEICRDAGGGGGGAGSGAARCRDPARPAFAAETAEDAVWRPAAWTLRATKRPASCDRVKLRKRNTFFATHSGPTARTVRAQPRRS
jgi:hypothetical protein